MNEATERALGAIVALIAIAIYLGYELAKIGFFFFLTVICIVIIAIPAISILRLLGI